MSINALNRGDFLKGVCAAVAVGASGGVAAGPGRVGVKPTANVKIRSALLHLGMSMWGNYSVPSEKRIPGYMYARDECPTEPEVWRKVTAQMRKRGYNQAIIDLGGGVEFPSHPEITVKKSRSAQWMRDEVRRLADMGIEAIPKLNFAATHDAWMGIYERMVSTPKYYEVVRDLIEDAMEMFGNPRFFHLGLDEEDAEWQNRFSHVTVRRGEMWWQDFKFYLNCLEKHNSRAIVFGDSCASDYEDQFYKRMPRSVVQNVGVYGHAMTLEMAQRGVKREGGEWWRRTLKIMQGMFRKMSDSGYDILSCASNWTDRSNKKKYPVIKYGKDYPQDRESIAWLHNYLAKEVSPERLIGGMTAPWLAMEQKYLPCWIDGIDQLADAMESHGWKSR